MKPVIPKYILAMLAVATSVAMAQMYPTKSEVADARDAAHVFIDTLKKFMTAKQWDTLVDQLEHDARQYVGKSKIQVAAVDREDVPADVKKKFVLMVVKLDEAAVQAIRFSEAFHKAAVSLKNEDVEEAETARAKFVNAAEDWARATMDAAGR